MACACPSFQQPQQCMNLCTPIPQTRCYCTRHSIKFCCKCKNIKSCKCKEKSFKGCKCQEKTFKSCNFREEPLKRCKCEEKPFRSCKCGGEPLKSCKCEEKSFKTCKCEETQVKSCSCATKPFNNSPNEYEYNHNLAMSGQHVSELQSPSPLSRFPIFRTCSISLRDHDVHIRQQTVSYSVFSQTDNINRGVYEHMEQVFTDTTVQTKPTVTWSTKTQTDPLTDYDVHVKPSRNSNSISCQTDNINRDISEQIKPVLKNTMVQTKQTVYCNTETQTDPDIPVKEHINSVFSQTDNINREHIEPVLRNSICQSNQPINLSTETQTEWCFCDAPGKSIEFNYIPCRVGQTIVPKPDFRHGSKRSSIAMIPARIRTSSSLALPQSGEESKESMESDKKLKKKSRTASIAAIPKQTVNCSSETPTEWCLCDVPETPIEFRYIPCCVRSIVSPPKDSSIATISLPLALRKSGDQSAKSKESMESEIKLKKRPLSESITTIPTQTVEFTPETQTGLCLCDVPRKSTEFRYIPCCVRSATVSPSKEESKNRSSFTATKPAQSRTSPSLALHQSGNPSNESNESMESEKKSKQIPLSFLKQTDNINRDLSEQMAPISRNTMVQAKQPEKWNAETQTEWYFCDVPERPNEFKYIPCCVRPTVVSPPKGDFQNERKSSPIAKQTINRSSETQTKRCFCDAPGKETEIRYIPCSVSPTVVSPPKEDFQNGRKSLSMATIPEQMVNRSSETQPERCLCDVPENQTEIKYIPCRVSPTVISPLKEDFQSGRKSLSMATIPKQMVNRSSETQPESCLCGVPENQTEIKYIPCRVSPTEISPPKEDFQNTRKRSSVTTIPKQTVNGSSETPTRRCFCDVRDNQTEVKYIPCCVSPTLVSPPKEDFQNGRECSSIATIPKEMVNRSSETPTRRCLCAVPGNQTEVKYIPCCVSPTFSPPKDFQNGRERSSIPTIPAQMANRSSEIQRCFCDVPANQTEVKYIPCCVSPTVVSPPKDFPYENKRSSIAKIPNQTVNGIQTQWCFCDLPGKTTEFKYVPCRASPTLVSPPEEDFQNGSKHSSIASIPTQSKTSSLALLQSGDQSKASNVSMKNKKESMESKKESMKSKEELMESKKESMESKKESMESKKESMESKKKLKEIEKESMESELESIESEKQMKKKPLKRWFLRQKHKKKV